MTAVDTAVPAAPAEAPAAETKAVLPHAESWADDIDDCWELMVQRERKEEETSDSTQGASSGVSSPMKRRNSFESFDACSPPWGDSPNRTQSLKPRWRRSDPSSAGASRSAGSSQEATKGQQPIPFPSEPPLPLHPAAHPPPVYHYPSPHRPNYHSEEAAPYYPHPAHPDAHYVAPYAMQEEMYAESAPFHVLPYAYAPVVAPAPPAYSVGQRVLVLRTCGGWTPATVARFAGDSYVLQMTETKTKTIPLRLVAKYMRPDA